MSVFGDVRESYRARLAAAFGETAQVTCDPAALVPYVLVDAVTVVRAAGVGGWEATLPVRCVVPGPGDAAALAALETMVETVLATLGGTAAYPDVHGPTDLPCYVATYPVQIPNPDC